MDAETKTLLSALVEGQLKIAESQSQLVESHLRLAQGQDELRKEMARGHQKLEAAITHVSKRLDWFGQQIVRGFTASATRDTHLDRRVTKLERAAVTRRKRPKKR